MDWVGLLTYTCACPAHMIVAQCVVAALCVRLTETRVDMVGFRRIASISPTNPPGSAGRVRLIFSCENGQLCETRLGIMGEFGPMLLQHLWSSRNSWLKVERKPRSSTVHKRYSWKR